MRGRAEHIDQLLLDLGWVERQVGRHGPCSTEYVRGREAGEPADRRSGVIANCNRSVILQEVSNDGEKIK